MYVNNVMQDYHWCSPTASVCYTTVSQETLIAGCDVSCTGLYADVTFTEDTVLNTETPFSGSFYGSTININRNKDGQGKERQKLEMMLERYTGYKKNFVKQIQFDAKRPDLSEYIYLYAKSP